MSNQSILPDRVILNVCEESCFGCKDPSPAAQDDNVGASDQPTK